MFPEPPTRALSIRQPWAWAVAAGFKSIENRTWQTSFRGSIAIHASESTQAFTEDAETELYDCGGQPLIDALDADENLFGARYFGAIIGVAELVDVVPIDSIPELSQDVIDACGDGPVPDAIWAQGPYCWRLRNAVFFRDRPIKCTGRVNLFGLPPDVQRKVAAELSRLAREARLPQPG